jgi:hypothetical protein
MTRLPAEGGAADGLGSVVGEAPGAAEAGGDDGVALPKVHPMTIAISAT